MRKIIVTVAPVTGEGPDQVEVPLNPEDIASDVVASAEAGASMVHLHVRDLDGKLTEDLSVFSHTLDLIRDKSNIIIQGSTGGVSTLSLDERCVAINDERVEVASLNMGSVNFGDEAFINTLPDIRYWAGRMKEKGICPELEIFEIGMINNVLTILEEGYLPGPYYFNFTLGIKGAMMDNVNNLFYLKESLPSGATWGFVHHGMKDLGLLAAAIEMGASLVRCGFEDSFTYAPGVVARTNYEIVEKVVKMIKSMGLEIANPDEARSILGLEKK